MKILIDLSKIDMKTVWQQKLFGKPVEISALDDRVVVLTYNREDGVYISALNILNGNVLWETSYLDSYVSGLVVHSDPKGSLLLISICALDFLHNQGMLIALDKKGEERWRWSSSHRTISRVYVENHLAWFTSGDNLVCWDLDKVCEQNNIHLTSIASLSAPLVVNNLIFVPCRDSGLIAVNADGSLQWHTGREEIGWQSQAPVLGNDFLFIACDDGSLCRLNKQTGHVVDKLRASNVKKSLSQMILSDGILYASARDGLYALDIGSNDKIWHFKTTRIAASMPVVKRGNVFFTCHDHFLYTLDKLTGKKQWHFEMESRIEISPLVIEEMVVLADRNGTLTAIECPMSLLQRAKFLVNRAEAMTELMDTNVMRQAIWQEATRLFLEEGEIEDAGYCQHQASRHGQLPIIVLSINYDGLVRDEWRRLQFNIRNDGYGPAYRLTIQGDGKQFRGQITQTRQINTLRQGQSRSEWLDVCPIDYGPQVPLRLQVVFVDCDGKHHEQPYTIYLKVLKEPTDHLPKQDWIQFPSDFAWVHWWEKINRHFNNEEFRDLCFVLNIDPDDLPAQGKRHKIRELLLLLGRQKRFSELKQICERERPEVNWVIGKGHGSS